MKEPRVLLGKTDKTSGEMPKVIMQNSEPVSTREDTERLMKILNITKAELEQVDNNSTQMNADERTQLIRRFKDV